MGDGYGKGERKTRMMVKSSRKIYLEVCARSHDEHHDILQDFKASDWTTDKGLAQNARDAYAWKSIGQWLKHTSDEAVKAYFEYRDARLHEAAWAFLKENGVVSE